jgi:hypothetical protein
MAFFAYAGDKVIVLKGSGDSVINIFQFPDAIWYPKYNPVPHTSDLYMPGVNMTAIFNNPIADREDIFIVTPNLDIMLVHTDDLKR